MLILGWDIDTWWEWLLVFTGLVAGMFSLSLIVRLAIAGRAIVALLGVASAAAVLMFGRHGHPTILGWSVERPWEKLVLVLGVVLAGAFLTVVVAYALDRVAFVMGVARWLLPWVGAAAALGAWLFSSRGLWYAAIVATALAVTGVVIRLAGWLPSSPALPDTPPPALLIAGLLVTLSSCVVLLQPQARLGPDVVVQVPQRTLSSGDFGIVHPEAPPSTLAANVVVEKIDLAAASAQVLVRLRASKKFAPPRAQGAPTTARLRVVSFGKGLALSEQILSLKSLTQTAEGEEPDPSGPSVDVPLTVPMQRVGLFPLDRYDLSVVVELRGASFDQRVDVLQIDVAQLPQDTRWIVTESPGLWGWRPSALVLYTLVLALTPLGSLLLLRQRRGDPSGNAWEVIAALVAIVTLRVVLVPEGTGTVTLVDIMLALQAGLILVWHYVGDTRHLRQPQTEAGAGEKSASGGKVEPPQRAVAPRGEVLPRLKDATRKAVWIAVALFALRERVARKQAPSHDSIPGETQEGRAPRA